MNEDERKFLLAKLRETRDVFLAEVRNLSEIQSRWKPEPDRWSILECAEHVTVAEQRMLHLLTSQMKPLSAPSNGKGREQEILAGGADRSKKFTAPEPARPAGRFANLDEAAKAFEESRSRTIAYIENCREDLRAREGTHARLGLVTGQECLALLTIHPARHALQVRELRQHPQFPNPRD